MKLALDSLCILVLALALGATSTVAWGQTVELTPSQDATLYEEPNTANGGGRHLFAGSTASGALRRALLRFDVAAEIPPGSIVDSVALELVLDRTMSPPASLTVHRVSQSWGEGVAEAMGEEGAGAPAGSGDATWQDRFHPDVAWSTPGGDYTSTPSATTLTGGLGLVSFAGEPGLVADVQSWIDDPSSNHGWMVIGEEATFRSAKRFGSRESADPMAVPALVVEYRPPSIPTLGSAALVSCALLLAVSGLWLARRL